MFPHQQEPRIMIIRTMIMIHSGRLTWNLIMEVWKIIFLSKWVIGRCHVNLPGCNNDIHQPSQLYTCFNLTIPALPMNFAASRLFGIILTSYLAKPHPVGLSEKSIGTAWKSWWGTAREKQKLFLGHPAVNWQWNITIFDWEIHLQLVVFSSQSC